MKIALGADHGGLELKNHIKGYLLSKGYEVVDFGTDAKESCDYPDFAYSAAKAVSEKQADCGMVFCTTGIGVAIAANKVKGVRCAEGHNEDAVRLTRRHNDANMLAFGAKYITPAYAELLAQIFLNEQFDGGRHLRRIEKITEIENRETNK